MWESILTAVAISIITAVVGIIGKAVNDWSVREKLEVEKNAANEAKWDAMSALRDGVAIIGETVVKDMKTAAEDGKLSKDEIKDVQKKAISEAVKIATNPDAVEFLFTTAYETLAAIISGIVQGDKKDQ